MEVINVDVIGIIGKALSYGFVMYFLGYALNRAFVLFYKIIY